MLHVEPASLKRPRHKYWVHVTRTYEVYAPTLAEAEERVNENQNKAKCIHQEITATRED